jgi:2-phospho-L-lactate transferase/gluconeogenesis factor (CofD/UPF0052 family)
MWPRHLAGRVDEVTRYERLLPLRRDPHTDMSGRRFEPHFIAQLVIGLDPIEKARRMGYVLGMVSRLIP